MNFFVKLHNVIAGFFRKAFRFNVYDVIAIAAVSVMTAIDMSHGGFVLSFSIGAFSFSMSHVLMFLLGTFFGYADVSFVTLILFGYACATNFSYAYNTAVFLFIGMMGYRFAKHRIYRRETILLPLIAAALMALLGGNCWYLLICLISPMGFSRVNPFGMVLLFMYMFPEYLLSAAIAYTFYTRASDDTLRKIYCG